MVVMAPAKTAQGARDVTAELAFLTRALKAPTLRESVTRLAERARAESWTQQIGGSARGYFGVGGASQQSRHGLLDGRMFCILIHRHPWADCLHLPRTGRAWWRGMDSTSVDAG